MQRLQYNQTHSPAYRNNNTESLEAGLSGCWSCSSKGLQKNSSLRAPEQLKAGIGSDRYHCWQPYPFLQPAPFSQTLRTAGFLSWNKWSWKTPKNLLLWSSHLPQTVDEVGQASEEAYLTDPCVRYGTTANAQPMLFSSKAVFQVKKIYVLHN